MWARASEVDQPEVRVGDSRLASAGYLDALQQKGPRHLRDAVVVVPGELPTQAGSLNLEGNPMRNRTSHFHECDVV